MPFPEFPAWRHGPNGHSLIVNSEEETPAGYVDHPLKLKGAPKPAEGTHTAVQPANTTVSAARAAKTTTAPSQTITPPAVAALTDLHPSSGTPAVTTDETNEKANPTTVDMDSDGHVFDPALHAATKSKTKAGLWRMKVGVTRPAAKPPLDL